MAFLRAWLVAFCAAATAVLASSSPISSTVPIVALDSGLFIGTTANDTNQFLGIPYAKPPVGNLRFRPPESLDPYVGEHNATAFGLSCPQQGTNPSLPSGLPPVTLGVLQTFGRPKYPAGEDCLTVNVITPSQAKHGSNLPVVVWLYGGGFEDGGSSSYDGTVIVTRSIALQEPVIYVSLNFRISAFGFLGSQEVKDARVGNLGLRDQRLALRWVQKYIHAFGGDPTKVTLWGQSSGAISASLQMLTNGGNTEGLFRATFLQSGSPTPVGDITHGQKYYNFLVESTGCSGSPDTLDCLRRVPFDELQAAVNNTPSFTSYQSLDLAWQPRADGDFLADNPQKLVQQGKVANIPFVSGACDDEGTPFSLSQTNITTDAELHAYLQEFFLKNVSDAEVDKLLTLYPQDPTQGSPFGTGTQNALTPQYKRIAAILGDLVFQAPKRFLLDHVSEKQNTWSYLTKRFKPLPILGSVHSSDLTIIYGRGDLTDYLINFATNLNPNGASVANWPPYTNKSPQLLTLYDAPVPTNVTLDTYRAEGMKLLTEISLVNPA